MKQTRSTEALMTTTRHLDNDPRTHTKAPHNHFVLFVAEGFALISLGLLAIIVPSISNAKVNLVLGLLLLISGAVGLATSGWARQAPGRWWSLISAILAIVVGTVLSLNKPEILYGGLMGWPFEETGPLRRILALFFLAEGYASVMFAFVHRRHLFKRWLWMLASGFVDIVLATIIIFGLPGASAWTMGLLVGINMIFGGFALIGMGWRESEPNVGAEHAIRSL
jgi:uncharacterized membrane protein HdeD (DUF308 family)